MYFANKIKDLIGNNKAAIFVDMDGVIADFEFLAPLEFRNKRPLTTNINTLKEVSLLENVELYILSVCRKDFEIEDKNYWLDNHAPFFKKENRIIISKESFPNLSSSKLKGNFLRTSIEKINDRKIIVIDDDNLVLRYLSQNFEDVILFQDSSLID
ncbi:MAG: hypothetical protein ACM3O4_01660 [Ignavibacteriales bacterium]